MDREEGFGSGWRVSDQQEEFYRRLFDGSGWGSLIQPWGNWSRRIWPIVGERGDWHQPMALRAEYKLRDEDWLLVSCWCERSFVEVPQEEVLRGLTRSCSFRKYRRICKPPRRQ